MSQRRTEFVPYAPKTILNKGKRADHWFWSRYSAYPYLGCQHGCEFCYCRERKYSPYEQPEDFAYIIKVKTNAAALLRQSLRQAAVDVVFTGDYQPAERKFGLSRQMLEVCCELGFPVFVLERSPLVLRDLDVLQAIHRRARAVVAFSIIYTPDSPNAARLRSLERLAPPPEKRFRAMEQFAAAGIVTGTCCMPVLPGLCDDEENLRSVVRWTADSGGQFVITSGLTLADQQRDHFLEALAFHIPELLPIYQRLYPVGESYGPVGNSWLRIARGVREYCQQAGIRDRVPRPIIPGEKRALNKRVVEALAERIYALELDGAPAARQWAYRKAAWVIEDLEQDVGLVHRTLGRKGLESIPAIGPGLAGELEQLIQTCSTQEEVTL